MDTSGYAFAVSFFMISLLGTASPGPTTMYVARQGFVGGMPLALASLLGILVGDVIYILLVVSGLSTLLLASCRLLDAITYLGSAYMAFMAWKMIRGALRQATSRSEPAPAGQHGGFQTAFRGALTLHATNPKALIYFGSIFIQFVNPATPTPIWQQLGFLAAIHLPTAALVLLAYSALGSHFRRHAPGGQTARWLDGLTGLFLIGSAVAITGWRLQGAGYCGA